MEDSRETMAKDHVWPTRTLLLIRCLFILLAATWPYTPEAFNVDKEYPIIYSGPNNSYFGYSLIFGQYANTYWLLTGAPKSNQTAQPDLREPGAIYQCIFPTGTEVKSCAEVTLDKDGNNVDSHQGHYYHNLKDGGWLGVSLDVTNDHNLIVACAHRWQDQKWYQTWLGQRNRHLYDVPDTHANGMCYTLTPDLKLGNVRKYIPLLSPDYQVLQGKTNNYIFAMAGLSAHFLEHRGLLILGAPGVYNLTGNVVSVLRHDNSITALAWGPNIPSEKAEPDYFGYSVSSGAFSSDVRTSLILVGAPRQRYKGKVYLITEVKKNTQIKYTWAGENMGEYFGASVCATDLNGDNLADAIIGAPFYRNITQSGYDHGKVYVSLNLGKMTFAHARSDPPWLELYGPSAQNARFGSAVSCIGDLDMDDLNDIAVGAPYEEDGAGAVYIYYGDRRRGIANDYFQKLIARDIDRSLRGFGISIAKSFDVDRNAFPDLGIGSYASDQAVIMRTHPVVSPQIELKTQPEKISITTYNCNHGNARVRCFKATVCFSYTTKSLSYRYLDFNYTVSVDGDHKGEKARGVVVDDGIPVNGTINVAKRMGTCITFTINLRVSFLTECNNTDVCKSDLQLQAWVTYQNQPVNNPTLQREVNKTLVINTKITNSGEHAYLTELNISLPWDLRLEKAPTACVDLNSLNEEFHYIICDIGNPLTEANSIRMPLIINVDQLSWDDTLLRINISVKTGSNEENLEDNRVELQISVRTEADIYVIGMPSDEYISYDNYGQNTINFTHNYTVINAGPAKLPKVTVQIQVPQGLGDTVFLKTAIVRTVDGSKGARVMECRGASTSYLTQFGDDRLFITQPGAARKRRKREPDQSSLRQHRNGFTLICNGEIKCRTIECDVSFMPADDSVRFSVQMEVSHKDLGELKLKKEIVDFTTRADAYILKLSDVIQPDGHKPDFYELVTSLDSARPETESLADWIIPVCIVAGFLLLLLIALILYKVGFFQRNQRDQMKLMQEGDGNPSAAAGFQTPDSDQELLDDEEI